MAIERCHRNSGFTRIYPNSMVIFPRFVLVYQRVFPIDVPVQNAGFPCRKRHGQTVNPVHRCSQDHSNAAGEKDCLAAWLILPEDRTAKISCFTSSL